MVGVVVVQQLDAEDPEAAGRNPSAYNGVMPSAVPYFVIALTLLAGGGSLALFALFLFTGPFGLLDLSLTPGWALVWDAALCLAFCLQHSIMVRRSVRRRVERIVPAPFYGALFTIASAVALLVLLPLWQESPIVVGRLQGGWRWAARVLGLASLPGFVWGARSIPRFDPLAIAPIKDLLRGRAPRRWPLTLRGPYRWVRHPQYFFALVLIWAYPDLTADRLLLNGILSAWIVLGTVLEERDLVGEFGADHVEFRRRVPMLIPWRGPVAPDE